MNKDYFIENYSYPMNRQYFMKPMEVGSSKDKPLKNRLSTRHKKIYIALGIVALVAIVLGLVFGLKKSSKTGTTTGSGTGPAPPVKPGTIPSTIMGVYVSLYGLSRQFHTVLNQVSNSTKLSYINTIVWWPGDDPATGIQTLTQSPTNRINKISPQTLSERLTCLKTNGKCNIFCLGGGSTIWNSYMLNLSKFKQYIDIIKKRFDFGRTFGSSRVGTAFGVGV